MKKIKFLLIIFMASFLLTGCTERMVDKTGEKIIDPHTMTEVVDNIVCQPNDKELSELYKKNGKDISKLDKCEDVKILKWHNGIWDTFFVYPIATLFIKIGNFCNNFIFAIFCLVLFSKLISLNSARKLALNEAKMKKIQPQVKEINERYKGLTDSESVIAKSDELKKLYEDNEIKPMAGCLSTLIQFPILFAIIDVLHRVPLFSTSNVFGINLAMSPTRGLMNGNYLYLVLALLLIGLAFLQSMIKTTDRKYGKQDFIMAGVIVFIVSSFAFSLPSGVAIYLLFSYMFGVLERIRLRYKFKKLQLSE